jgi:thioredoxin 2
MIKKAESGDKVMETLKIVCPHCNNVNIVENEVTKEDIPCHSCGLSLSDTTPIDCTTEVFKTHVTENTIPVLVDFYSPECAPCMKMAPDYEKAASCFALEVRFIKVNTVEFPDIARQYGVNMLPTTIAFKNGMEMNRFSSALSKEHLSMWAESLIQMVI